MIGPAAQKAIWSALTAANVCGGRIYDMPPREAVFPYASIGDEQVIDDSDSCQDGWEVFSDIHVWSRPVSGSKVEVKTEAAAAIAAVLGISSLAGFSLVAVFHETTRFLRDPDGLTEHGIITIKMTVSPA